MIETYQQEAALEIQEPENASFANVGAVYSDGVSLIFDGETEPSQKHYKVNAFMVFHAGDRVHILKDSGTYVVICTIGNPKTSFAADSATTAGSASTASTASNATNLGGQPASAYVPTSQKGVANGVASLNSSSKVVQTALNADHATDADTADAATNYSGKHTGTYLGFFNATGAGRQTVSLLSATPTLENLKTYLNAFITACKMYNLFY